MPTFRHFAIAATLFAAGLACQPARAQTTDGLHTIQVFPVVVDSASFTQRFTFRSPGGAAIDVSPVYYPGGGSQSQSMECPSFVIPGGQQISFASLRDICPSLAAGTQFGFLYAYETNSANRPFSGFSRVSNPQGNGFSVEAFAAKEFTSATSSVAGIRRMAATANSPAFQTNCFFAAMPDRGFGAAVTSTVNVTLFNNAGTQIGTTTQVTVAPGTLVRLLDVFAAVGAPAGDYPDARLRYFRTGDNFNGVIAFCTVQDNTSFGADFRIAKQEVNASGETLSSQAAQSDYVARLSSLSDINTSGGRRLMESGGSVPTSNTHAFYFHRPDYVQCSLVKGDLSQADVEYGLEMRMVAGDGVTVIAGGNDVVGWGEVYLGDKNDFNDGSDGRYTIEVEDNELGKTVGTRSYRILCYSGSGGTLGEIVRYQEAVDRF